MRDWRSALQSGTMRNVVASMLVLDAAGLTLVYLETGRAVGDGSLFDDVAAVAVRAESDFLPAPLPRPQAVVRVEFSDIPAAARSAVPFAVPFDRLDPAPALAFEELAPEPLSEPLDLMSDQRAQPAVGESPRHPVRLAAALPAPEMHRPTAAFSAAFPPADTKGADIQGVDIQGVGAPSIAVDETVYWGPSPATISGRSVHAAGGEQAPAVVDRPTDGNARAGEVAAGSADRVPQDTANDVEPRAELPA